MRTVYKKSKEDLYPEITPEAQRVSCHNCDKIEPQISFKFKDRLFPSPLPPSLGSALSAVSAQQTIPLMGPVPAAMDPRDLSITAIHRRLWQEEKV